MKDIWGLYGNQKKSFMMSFGFQIGLVLFVVLALSTKPVQKAVKSVVAIVMPVDVADVPKPAMHGGGGGGDRSPLPASKGKLPKPQLRQFVPPTAVINNPAPKLAMDPSILAPPDANLPNINLPNYGDPLGKLGPASNGTGSGGGIGSGKGGGVGSGTGGGVGPGSRVVESAMEFTAPAMALPSRNCIRRSSRSIPKKPARRNFRASWCCILCRS